MSTIIFIIYAFIGIIVTSTTWYMTPPTERSALPASFWAGVFALAILAWPVIVAIAIGANVAGSVREKE